MILSTPEFQTALRNDSTKADTSKDSTVDGCSFFPVLEEDPTPSSPEQTMTPLESVFAQAVKRNRQEEEECDSPSSKKPRRYRRIPCKARGILSASHNSNTAFFDIPLDASHGMLLSCSHPECSGSGRRFRWCNVCEMPFAKRNFLKRHGHGMMHSSKELRDDDMDNLLCQVIRSPLPPSRNNNNRNDQVSRRRHHRRVISFDQESADSSSSRISMEDCNEAIVSDHEQCWLELLKERPKMMSDETKMTAWMDKVISFSREEKVVKDEETKQLASFQIAPVERASLVSPTTSSTASSATTTMPNSTVSWTEKVGDAPTEPPRQTGQTELSAFMDDFDYVSAAFEDRNNIAEIEKFDRSTFCWASPVAL